MKNQPDIDGDEQGYYAWS